MGTGIITTDLAKDFGKNDFLHLSEKTAFKFIMSLTWWCDIWFVVELTLQFIAAKNRKAFMTRTSTWFDIIALVPFSMQYIRFFKLLSKIRIFQIFRLGKLAKYSKSLSVLGKTLVETREMLFMMIFLQFLLSIVFSSAAVMSDNDYFIHGHHKPKLNCKYTVKKSTNVPHKEDWP